VNLPPVLVERSSVGFGAAREATEHPL
jgi:hypothetical protein